MRDSNYGIQLANAAWFAPLLAISANLLAIVFGFDRLIATVIAGCGLALISFGFCATILAIDSIRSHGYRGTLLPAFIGLLLNGTLIAYILMSFLELTNLVGR